MLRRAACLWAALLTAALLRSAHAAEPSISFAYTFQLNPGATSYVQTGAASSAQGVACNGDSDCRSKCPTTDFTADNNANVATLQQQLYDCANAFRTSPETFTTEINALCSFSAFQSTITTPRRAALAGSQQLAQIAEDHTNDMAANNSFSHTSTSGQSPADRVRTAFPNSNTIGEVIAAGYTTVQSVILNMMCSDSHRAILTSCDYDTAGWGVEYGGRVNGQTVRSTYNSYFTGDYLCSNQGGCTCGAAPQTSPTTGPPVPTTVSPPVQTSQSSPPSSPPVVTSSPPPAPVQQNPPTSNSGAQQTQAPPSSPSPPPNSPTLPSPPNSPSPPNLPTLPSPPPNSPSPPSSPTPPSPIPTGTPPNGPPQGAQSTGAIAVTFDIIFNQIPANSLNAAQTASVVDDVRRAISGYISPTSAGISINGSGPPPALSPPSPGNPGTPGVTGSTQSNAGNNPPGFPPPPINYNPPSPTGFPPPPINFNPPAPNTGRRLQQAENTVQSTVTFLATTTAPSSADSASLISALTSDINTYNAPVTVTTTATPITSGSTLVFNVSVQYPPNNQVSSQPGYTTQLASSFGSAAANQTATVFSTYEAANGPLTVTRVQTVVSPVTATGGSNLGPGAPVRVIGSGPGSSPTSPASPPTGAQQASPPSPTPTPTPPQSPSPTPQQSPSPVPQSPTPASPPIQTPPSTGQNSPSPTSPTPQAPPTSPTPTTSQGPASPPTGSSPPLVLEATVTLRDNETALIQNLTQGLQSNPQAVLYALIARDGNITVANVQNSQGSGAAIEEAPPTGPTTSFPVAPTTATPAPSPGQTSTNASVCTMFALNMQFTTGQAATDQTSATLMAGFPRASGPLASGFTVLLSDGRRGSVDSVVPYTASYFLLRVTTPAGYYGTVTVSYTTAELESLQYNVVPSLVVKVTASSLTASSR